MPNRTNAKVCIHIKVTGVRCGSPALRGEQFCYFHQRMIRTVKAPDSRLHHVALLENEEAVQASLMEVVNALIRGTIELKRGELILRALNTAARNISRARFGQSTNMVTQLPDYGDPEPAKAGTPAPTPAPVAPAALDPNQPKPPVSDRSAQVPSTPLRASLQSRKQRAPSG